MCDVWFTVTDMTTGPQDHTVKPVIVIRLTLPGEEDDSQTQPQPPDVLHPHLHLRHQAHDSPMFLDVCKIHDHRIANIFPGHHTALPALAEGNCPFFIFCWCGHPTTTVVTIVIVSIVVMLRCVYPVTRLTGLSVVCRYLCSQRC